MRHALLAGLVTAMGTAGFAISGPAFGEPPPAGQTEGTAAGSAAGEAGTKPVTYGAFRFDVPSNWPVYDLDRDPSRCVRFDIHAVYLGRPGSDQVCPARIRGRTEAVQVEPMNDGDDRGGEGGGEGGEPAVRHLAAPDPTMAVQDSVGRQQRVAIDEAHVRMTVTYGEQPEKAQRIIRSGRLVRQMRAPGPAPSPTPSVSASPSAPASPGSATSGPAAVRTSPVAPRRPERPGRPEKVLGWSKAYGVGWYAVPSSAPYRPIMSAPDHGAPRSHPRLTLPPSITPPHRVLPSLPDERPDPGLPVPSLSLGPVTSPGPAGSRAQSRGTMEYSAARLTGRAFDTCTAPSLKAMRAWRSSFQAANIYIGGAARACGDGNLSKAWVSSVRKAGWRLIPTYVGLQAPCNAYNAKISTKDPGTQGRDSADDAIADAKSFGLPKRAPLYFDMEGYDNTKKWCSGAVLKFLDGWTARLHQRGHVSGVYGSVSSTITDLGRASKGTMPDGVWFAHWDGHATTTSPYMSAAWWPNRQRIKQYRGTHEEKHGGVRMSIDSNQVDGFVY